MKIIKISPILILLSCVTHKDIKRAIEIKPIGWLFTLPIETNFQDSAFDTNGKLTGKIPNKGPSLRLFTIKDSSLGFFSAYLRKDTSTFETWKNHLDSDTKSYFEQLKQLPQIEVFDTKYFTKTIDSINFLIQYAKYIRKGKSDTGYVYHHFGKIKDVELDISFDYYDTSVGKKYMDIVQSSEFKD